MATPTRESLTFSQANNLEPLPAPLRLGEIPQPVRNALFAVFVREIENAHQKSYIYESPMRRPERRMRLDGGFWSEALWRKHVHFDHAAADELDLDVRRVLTAFKQLCMDAPYSHLLDVIEFLARQDDRASPYLLELAFNEAFEQYRVPYRLVQPGPSVIALAGEGEGRAVQEAFAALGADEFSGARKHLRDAGIYLGQPGKEADSVRESIHAVEAVCKVIAGTPDATLTSALGRFKNKAPMHAAFSTALEKLYSYTNDEKGIRHALLDDAANVDAADAQFMYGACAGFVSFLITKARAAGLR